MTVNATYETLIAPPPEGIEPYDIDLNKPVAVDQDAEKTFLLSDYQFLITDSEIWTFTHTANLINHRAQLEDDSLIVLRFEPEHKERIICLLYTSPSPRD